MFYKNKILLLVLLSVFMTEPKKSYATSCNVTNGYDVLSCALQKSPELVRAKAQAPVYWQYEKQAGKWFAPELDAGVNYTKADDEKGVELELALLQQIENPNKREARKNLAGAEFSSAKLFVQEQENKTTFEVLTLLNRLRQISQEKSVLNEAIETYQSVLKRYNNLSALSPEDEVSKDVFDIASKNYKIEKQKLEDEENTYKTMLQTMLGKESSEKVGKSCFLYAPRKFPELKPINVDDSLEMQREKLDVEIAQATYKDAKASNFSGVNVGPYIATKPRDMGRLDTYGLKFSFPIPVNSNKNAIKGANFAVQAAEQSHELRKMELERSVLLLQEKYNQGKKMLKSIDISSLEKRHKKLENLFATGRVSTSLFIEAHEQLFEASKTYNSYELETLQALWNVYAMNKTLVSSYREVSYAK